MSPATRRARIDEAVAFKKRRDLGQAFRLLEGLVAESPEDDYAAGHLAHVLLLRGRPREAAEMASGLLARHPASSFVLYVRGEARLKLKQWGPAAEDLAAAAAAGFDSAHLYARLADARRRAGDAEGARQALGQGLQKFPGDSRLLLAVARDERSRGEEAAAERHVEQAVEAADSAPLPYAEMMATRARKKGRPEAVEELRRLLKIPSQAKNPHLHDQLARLLQENKDPAGAAEASRRALELEPGNAFLHKRLAWALVRAGQDREAVQELEACLDREPEDPTLHRSYLAARKRLGELDQAHGFYVALLRRHPEAPRLFGWMRRAAREAESSSE